MSKRASNQESFEWNLRNFFHVSTN
uniref:Uncharacterized protein n=1 Tax=Rhizophora mucronata TaxID=61149 RepID=A0A2P2NKW4_RHIMU